MTRSARQAQSPASAIPLAYLGLAHVSLACALVELLLDPALPTGFFYHPKMVALTHLLTLGWLSGSILGALYVVAPLALGCPLPARRGDWIAWAAYGAGLIGMVTHFWIAEYGGMTWSAGLVAIASGWVGWRLWRGLSGARVPWGVALHVRLAFVNLGAAAALGILIGVDRTWGVLTISPLVATYAHAHLAAVGWVGMMVIGVAYRMIPMMLPSAMPSGRGLAASAVLIEAGLAVLVLSILTGSTWLPLGTAFVVAGLAAAGAQLGRAAADRRPRPPRLPAIDWSMWHVAGAAVWLAVAIALGGLLTFGVTLDAWYVESLWLYGVAGLVGWQAQMVAAVLGRLAPTYAWYRALARRGGEPPDRAVHDLVSGPFAACVCFAWAAGVPLLAAGLSLDRPAMTRVAAILLLAGVVASATHAAVMLRRADRPQARSLSRRQSASGDEAAAGQPGNS